MLRRAELRIDLAKIEDNTRSVISRLPGLDVVGVTKVTCGSPEVARAILAGGATAIGESRLENVERLRAAGIEGPFWLLRAAVPSVADDAVRLVDVSLATELVSVRALDDAASRAGRRHGILAMVDLGDLREGIMPGDLPAFLQEVAAMGSVDVVGVGTSLTCYGAVCPTPQNLGELVALAGGAEKLLGRPLVVSGGMSSSIEMAFAGAMPAGITNLRIGESILLGVSTVTREPMPDLHTDAFVLSAPVIECKCKPSMPRGQLAQDAFGRVPDFVDRGDHLRAICAVGRQDAPPEGLQPLDEGVRVLGASSDHLVLDVEEMDRPPSIGGSLRFVPNYAATLRLSTSPYIDKRFDNPSTST